uniref:Uncharacterized protein n=1 Tax=Glossina austeni TaxID=7395 RepID=A0A1A9VHN3_GLOAU
MKKKVDAKHVKDSVSKSLSLLTKIGTITIEGDEYRTMVGNCTRMSRGIERKRGVEQKNISVGLVDFIGKPIRIVNLLYQDYLNVQIIMEFHSSLTLRQRVPTAKILKGKMQISQLAIEKKY